MVEICGWLIWKCICVLFIVCLWFRKGFWFLVIEFSLYYWVCSPFDVHMQLFYILLLLFLSIWCVVLIDPVSLHLRFCFCRKMGLCWRIIYYCMNLISLNLGFKLFFVCPFWLLEKIKDESTQKSVIYLVTFGIWRIRNLVIIK